MGTARTEAWAEARRLVVAEGYGYAEAAEATGLALSTVEKRAAAEAWQAQRQHAMSYGAQMRAIKAGYAAQLLALASQPENAQKAAQLGAMLTNLEKAYPEHRYAAKKEDPRLRVEIAIQVVEELVAYLGDASRTALAALQPFVEPFVAHLEAKLAR